MRERDKQREKQRERERLDNIVRIKTSRNINNKGMEN